MYRYHSSRARIVAASYGKPSFARDHAKGNWQEQRAFTPPKDEANTLRSY